MLKKLMPFVSVLVYLACTIAMLIYDSTFTLILFFTKDFFIPILHFYIVGVCIKGNEHKKITLAISTILLLSITIFVGRMLSFLPFPLNAFWFIICGIAMLVKESVMRLDPNNIIFKILFSLGSVIVLTANALAVHALRPILNANYSIDGIEIIPLAGAAVLLSAFSYLFGYTARGKTLYLKIALWFVGITISEYVAACLRGYPITFTLTFVGLRNCIVSSIIIFAWSLLGVFHQKNRIKTKHNT